MALQFEMSAVIPASAAELYEAWLDSAGHSAMTGGAAETSAEPGGRFTAWDGYIQGRNLELEPPRRIVQSWRTAEFEQSEPDSRLEVLFEPAEGGTRLTIRHTNLPAHGGQYEQGWVDNYFEPMKRYFQPAQRPTPPLDD
ncbi:MAG TPA: SRPBCC domain-containing protein [Anaerolineales bacterium]|nr:SRPBCC domain-containing protein [Anaerolineales bacterium]